MGAQWDTTCPKVMNNKKAFVNDPFFTKHTQATQDWKVTEYYL